MEKPDSVSGSDVGNVYHSVFIDTSLDTHLAMIVCDSDTVSDLKKKILYEHPLCFPNIGEININALKVKRRGYLYHLSDSMFVKSAFGGVSKSWFLNVDASSAEERRENHDSRKPDTSNILACFGITTNNSSADVVNLLPGDTSKRLSNINEASLPQDGGNRHAKHISASQQFGFSNSTKENSEDLNAEAEHTANGNSKVLLPVANKESRSKVQSEDVADDKIYEDLPASVAASVLKEKHKTKKRNKNVIPDHDLKENSALVVESGNDALDSGNVLKENSFQNRESVVLDDMNFRNQVPVDETCRSLSSDINKRSATGKRMGDEGTKVPGGQSECETNKHKDVSLSEQEYKSRQISSQSGPASKKMRKAKKKDGSDSLIENGDLISDFVKRDSLPVSATSKSSLGKNLESTSDILDHLNTESIKENCLLTADATGRRNKRKRQKPKPSQVGGEISSAKDVHVDTFQATEAMSHKGLGSEADPEFFLGKISMGGAISEPCSTASKELQEVGKTNGELLSGGDEAMADTNDGNMESQTEAPKLDVLSVIKTRDSIDQNASNVEGHHNIVSQEEINLQNDIGVSGHENQSGTLEDKIMEPKKSSKKMKKSKKTKDLVEGTEAVNAVQDRGMGSDISHADCPASENGVRFSAKAMQDGTTDRKEESKMKKSDSLPSVTDGGADDVIRDVLESLQQSNNGPENAENRVKKSRKKTKKKSSTLVDPAELQRTDDFDLQDPTVPADNVSEVSVSSNSTRKTVKVSSSEAEQLNGSDLGSKDNTGVGISTVHTQLDSGQNTLKCSHDGKPTQDLVDVHHPKSASVDTANNTVEVPYGSERVKSQERHEIVDSGETAIDKVTDKRGMEAEVTGKKKKPKVQSGGSRPVKSSSIQSQRSLSKVESYSSNGQPSKQLLTISESAAKEPPQSNKHDKINSILKDAQSPIGINSSGAHTNLEKRTVRAVSSSTLKRSKNTINLNKGGNEYRSHLDIAKASGSNNRKAVNSLANKKSLLGTAGTIFKHDNEESSDDEEGVDNSDASTRTPSDSSSSSENSDGSHSLRNGSHKLEGEEAGGRNRQKQGSDSQKSISLHAVLLNSSRYKKAKLTASQNLDSQADDFIPDSEAA